MTNQSLKATLIVFFLFTSSCAGSLESSKQGSSKAQKIDTKKLAKEAGYMIGWDIILATGCKAALHFSVGFCLAADIAGDSAIIAYSNFGGKDKKNDDKKSSDLKIQDTKEKEKFNPLEFFMGIGLMAITLVVI